MALRASRSARRCSCNQGGYARHHRLVLGRVDLPFLQLRDLCDLVEGVKLNPMLRGRETLYHIPADRGVSWPRDLYFHFPLPAAC